MGRHNDTHSSTAPTPGVGNQNGSHRHHINDQKQNNVPNRTLILGPMTPEKCDKRRHIDCGKELYSQTTSSKTKNGGQGKIEDKQEHNKNSAQEADENPSTTISLYMQKLVISIDVAYIMTLLIHSLSFKSVASALPPLWNDWDKMGISNAVFASPIATKPPINPALYAMFQYAKMASYPFLLFVPSLLILSATMFSLTENDNRSNRRNNSVQLMVERRNDRKRVLKVMSMCTWLLFIFLAALLACAETSRWIMLGVISIATPVILMLLARLSVVYADTSDVLACVIPGGCIAGLTSHGTPGILKAAKMIGFVFVFLPFLAGFFYVISPPYLLAVPLSSLTTCSLTGIFGIVPSLISTICLIIWWKSAYWILTRVFAQLFCIYSWFVKRNFSVLLFLVCIALFMTTRAPKFPSYL